MYEADEGERQRGNGREGRKTRRGLEGDGDNDLPDSRMKKREGVIARRAKNALTPEKRSVRRKASHGWRGCDRMGNARIATQKKALSLLSSIRLSDGPRALKDHP